MSIFIPVPNVFVVEEKQKKRKLSRKAVIAAIIFLLVILFFFFRFEGRSEGEQCLKNSDCESGFCIRRVCREDAVFCGDFICNPEENCTTCPEDCGECKKQSGDPCKWDYECYTGQCVHGICRPTNPYHGDGYCDPGEDCWTAPTDCGKCMWI